MEEVEGIIADVEDAYERVIAQRTKSREDEVESCKCTTSSSKLGHLLILTLPSNCGAIYDVAGYIYDYYEGLRTSWLGSRVGSVPDRERVMVPACPAGCIQEVSFSPSPEYVALSFPDAMVSRGRND
jgi:hypothetical protein